MIESLLELSHFHMEIREEWGSNSLEGRHSLRRALTSYIDESRVHPGGTPVDQKRLLLTPGERPLIPGIAWSISHTGYAGGYAVCIGQNVSLGFDLESFDRVTDKTIMRVSTAREVSEAPSPAALWCAKEAAFKAFSGLNIHILSDITVDHWLKIDQHHFTYRATVLELPNTLSGLGVIQYQLPLTMAIFKKSS